MHALLGRKFLTSGGFHLYAVWNWHVHSHGWTLGLYCLPSRDLLQRDGVELGQRLQRLWYGDVHGHRWFVHMFRLCRRYIL